MYMAFHNVLSGIAVFAGALIGGFLGGVIPTEVELFGQRYIWMSTLYGVFVVSALMRLVVPVMFLPHIKEIRPVRLMTVGGLIFRIARFHPLSGVFFDIIGVRRNRSRDSKS